MDEQRKSHEPTDDELKLPDDRAEDLEPDEQDADGVSGGLLLPAVQKAREAASRLTSG